MTKSEILNPKQIQNSKFKISKRNLIKLLGILKDKVNLLAPHVDQYGDTYFLPVSDASKIQLKHFKPLMPAIREVLFPQTNKMVAYSKTDKGAVCKLVDEPRETVLFSLPTCDLEGILYNDVFYGGREYPDYYYDQARGKLTIITMACITPPNENCFCASMGHGPFAEDGFDLQLTEMEGDYFIVDVGSEKGKKIISVGKNLFEAAVPDDISKWEEVKRKAEKLPVKDYLNKDRALEKMGKAPLDEKLMKDISSRCISCGACNYVCPTCECFNVVDIGRGVSGTRERILDSCVLSGYFRMAGGHNPKPEKLNRTCNRYSCKFIWDKEKFGDSGCVGCGRCLDSCPVDIDIKEVIKERT